MGFELLKQSTTAVGGTALTENATYSVYRRGEEVSGGLGSYYLAGDTLPFESTGLLLTHEAQTLSWSKRKLNADGSAGEQLAVGNSQSWRVSEDIIIVPVDLIETFSSPSIPPLLDLAGAQALIDDFEYFPDVPGALDEAALKLNEPPLRSQIAVDDIYRCWTLAIKLTQPIRPG